MCFFSKEGTRLVNLVLKNVANCFVKLCGLFRLFLPMICLICLFV